MLLELEVAEGMLLRATSSTMSRESMGFREDLVSMYRVYNCRY